MRGSRAVALLAVVAAGCASSPGGEGPAEGAGTGDTEIGEVRFAIEVAAADHPAVLVQATSESRSVGWLRVLREGRAVHVEAQCGVPDCDDPGAVCGANIPTVREVAAAGAAGSIEYLWDGTGSVIDEAVGCERRAPAPPGEYLARFCHGSAAQVDGDLRAPGGAVGYVTEPVCVDRPFRLGRDADVVLRIP